MLGWSALFADGQMTATATVLEATCTIAFPGRMLRELCDHNHELGYRIMRQAALALSQRLLATRLQLLDLFVPPQ